MIDGFELDLQPYCKGCPEFDPEATFNTDSSDGLIWNIRCGNRGRCVRLMRHLNKKMEEKERGKLEESVAN